MNRYLKKILLVILEDGTRLTYSIPEDKSPEEIYRYAVSLGEIEEEQVKSVLYFPHTLYEIEEFQYYYDEETKTLDEKTIAVKFKIDEFRKQRGLLFKALDMEFMRTLEVPDCKECVDKVVSVKDHLRKLPDLLPDFLENLSVEEIAQFNCFNNVYDIAIINGGAGYIEAPEVIITPPDIEGSVGFGMKAEASIKGGNVTEIKVTQIGSNYRKAPFVTFSKPAEGNIAIAIASEPENDIL